MMRCMGILSVCLYVLFTFRIYSCFNSTITHAQNLCAKFLSFVVWTCSYVCVSEFDEYEVHELHLRTRINQSQYRSL